MGENATPSMQIVGNCIDHVHLHTHELKPPVRLLTELFGSQFCGAYDVPSAGTRTAYNPSSGLEVSVPLKPDAREASGQEGRIFRICFVVKDLERARAHFEARGVRLINEVELPNIAHELQFDPRDTFGIALQLGVWGPGLPAILEQGIVDGREQYPAPAALPVSLIQELVERVHCVVEDLERASAFFSDLLAVPFNAPFEIPEWKVRASTSPLGLVLMQPTAPDSAVAESIAEQGSQHIVRVCFSVRDLEQSVAHFSTQGQSVENRLEREGLQIAHFLPGNAFGIGISLRELNPVGVELPEAGI